MLLAAASVWMSGCRESVEIDLQNGEKIDSTVHCMYGVPMYGVTPIEFNPNDNNNE